VSVGRTLLYGVCPGLEIERGATEAIFHAGADEKGVAEYE